MAFNTSDWLVSSWDAGQSSLMSWSKDNVRFNSDGSADFILSEAPAGSSRPYLGGEIQSDQVATTGTWSWVAKVPEMVDGAIFGMFLYREEHWTDPWLEYDFEFVGGDTTKVQLAIHMEDADGRHISSGQLNNGPHIVDLGFDASKREAHYEVTITDTSATFRVDGKVVGTFDASDMPGGVWYTNPMKSFVDLWAVAPAQEAWAGEWNYPGSPLVATVESYEIRPGEYTTSFDGTPTTPPDDDEPGEELPGDGDGDTLPPGSIVGTDANNSLNGTSGADVIYGLAGNDTLDGKGGADETHGGSGNDVYFVDNAGDQTIEKAGGGHDTTHATINWTLAGNVEALFLRSAATIDGTGNGRHNAITGNSAPNILKGGAGADVLDGRGGNDILIGGTGADRLIGDAGNDVMKGNRGADEMRGGAGNDVYIVANSGDQTIEEAGGGYDATHARISWTLAANVEALNLRTAAGIDGTGNAGDNAITGNSAANTLKGGAGADVLNGRGGNDMLIGGTGKDKLKGKSGADVLDGRGGKDILIGGAGDDTFVFTGGRDHVIDFARGDNQIDLTKIDSIDDFDGVLAAAGQKSTGVVVTLEEGTLRLDGVFTSNLDADDFLF